MELSNFFWLLDILGYYAFQYRANLVGKSVDCFRLLLDPPYIVRVATLDFLLLASLEIWLCGCMETLDHGSDDHGWR